jgi:hypothetical protein
MIERYSQRWIQGLERRKTMLPYSLVWCFLGLGLAFLFFGWIDRVWEYYLEGYFAVGTAVVLFIVETCWRRIVELKGFLSEYVEAHRNLGAEPAPSGRGSSSKRSSGS